MGQLSSNFFRCTNGDILSRGWLIILNKLKYDEYLSSIELRHLIGGKSKFAGFRANQDRLYSISF